MTDGTWQMANEKGPNMQEYWKPLIGKLVRQGLVALATALVGNGIMAKPADAWFDGTAEIVSGAIVGLGSAAWMWFRHHQTVKAAANPLLILLLPALGLGLCGCTSVNQEVTKVETTNGVTTYTIKFKGATRLQSAQALEKARGSVTKTGANINLTGLDQKSDLATALEAAGGLAKDISGAVADGIMAANGVPRPASASGNSATVPVPVVSAVPMLTVVTNLTMPDGGTITCYSDGSCIRTPPTTKK